MKMLHREFYTVDRTPEEVEELWNWACDEYTGKLAHEVPYVAGAYAVLEYLMGETEARPQDYKGAFTLQNVLREAQKCQKVGGVSETCVDEPLDTHFDSFRPGNPKTLSYRAPLVSGDVATGEGCVNRDSV